jgi:hypothetical protein
MFIISYFCTAHSVVGHQATSHLHVDKFCSDETTTNKLAEDQVGWL